MSRPIRTTYPGRVLGIVEWSDADMNRLQASIQSEQDLWEAYIESEDTKGFITNEMNDSFLQHALSLFPEYALNDKRKLHFNEQLQALVVDLRFRAFGKNGFGMWSPSRRNDRQKLWSGYIKTGHAHRNGTVEWEDGRTQVLIDHLRTTNPAAWHKFCWRLDNIGFIGLQLEVEMVRQTPEIFPLPHDLQFRSIRGAMINLTEQACDFRMRREENRALMLRLNSEYMDYRVTDRPFEQWYEESRVLDEIGRPGWVDG